MFFDEDEEYIKSLTRCSKTRVTCVCPFCEKKKFLVFGTVVRHQSTYCACCSIQNREFLKIVGKRFGRLVVVSKSSPKGGNQYVECKCDCGNEIVLKVSSLKTGHTQSCGCFQTDMMKAKVGVLHPNFGKRGAEVSWYKHNITEEQRTTLEKSRASSKMNHFRKAVKERDGKKCVICGAKEKLVVHHLESFKDNESLRYEVSNGVTLCRDCHIEFHCTWMGHYRNICTEKDFNEYILQI